MKGKVYCGGCLNICEVSNKAYRDARVCITGETPTPLGPRAQVHDPFIKNAGNDCPDFRPILKLDFNIVAWARELVNRKKGPVELEMGGFKPSPLAPLPERRRGER